MKQITAGFLGMAFNYLKPVETTEKLDSDQFVDSFINLCNNLWSHAQYRQGSLASKIGPDPKICSVNSTLQTLVHFLPHPLLIIICVNG